MKYNTLTIKLLLTTNIVLFAKLLNLLELIIVEFATCALIGWTIIVLGLVIVWVSRIKRLLFDIYFFRHFI